MFTKKTRILSALLSVCMLISMLTCFVVPAVAAEETVAHVDTSEMTNANTLGTTYPTTVAKNYVITDLAGMKALARLTKNRGASFSGTTIYLGADIDMNWESFDGFGAGKDGYKANGTTVESNIHDNGNFAFKGTFDGNGYVIKNLYINRPNDTNVGLFNWYYGAAGTLKNIVIESGIIIGGTNTGSLVGKSWLGRIENCHSNAVVISDTATNYVGGLIGYERDAANTETATGAGTTSVVGSSFSGTVLDSGNDVTSTQWLYSKNRACGKLYGTRLTNEYPEVAGAIAQKMSALKVKSSFWKVVNGRVAVADEASQARKLTINVGSEKLEVYGSAGETVDLKNYFKVQGATVTLAEGDKGSLAEGIFTFGAGDSVITTDSAVNYKDLNTLVNFLEGLYEKFKAYLDSLSAADLIVQVKTAIAGGAYTNQAEVDAQIATLIAGYKSLQNTELIPATFASRGLLIGNYVLPAITTPAMTNTNINMYTEEDMLAVEKAGSFTNSQTLYLRANIDLKGSAFKWFGNLYAKFDGLGHTVRNYAPTEALNTNYGFFVSYDGPGVKGIVFDYDDDVVYKTTYGGASILMNSYQQHSGVTEGYIKDITIRNAKVNYSGTSTSNFALLVANLCQNGGKTVKIDNILLENNKIDSAKSNNALLIGKIQNNTQTVSISNVTIRNNQFGTASGNAYFAIEVVSPGAKVNVENVLIHGNKSKNTSSLFFIEHYSLGAPSEISFKNVIAYNNVVAGHTVSYRKGPKNTKETWIDTNKLSAHNVYVDHDKVAFYIYELPEGATEIANKSYTGLLSDMAAYGTIKAFADGTTVGDTEEFEKGIYAYAFNQKTENGTYVKMVNGKPVFTKNAAEQTRKLTVDFTRGGFTMDFYGSAGETVDLAKELGDESITYTEVDGSKGTLSEDIFTFGDGDGTLTTEDLMINDFRNLHALIKDQVPKHEMFWNTKAPGLLEKADAFAPVLETSPQADINAKVKELADMMKLTKDDKVPATMKDVTLMLNSIKDRIDLVDPRGSTTYDNVGIYSEEDLVYVSMGDAEVWSLENGVFNFSKGYTSNQTIHLMKDMNLSGTKFVRIHECNAKFDGHNHTIRNFNSTTTGFFSYFHGPGIENLNFENCHTTAEGNNSAFFIANTPVKVSNVTFNNCSIDNNGKLRVSFLAGFGYYASNFTNIEIRNCSVKGEKDVSAAFLISGIDERYDRDYSFKNILVDNCDFNDVNAQSALVLLKATSTDSTPGVNVVKVTNLILTNNTGAVDFSAKEDDNAHTVDFTNVAASNNELTSYENAYGINTNVVLGKTVGEAVYNVNGNLETPVFALNNGNAVFFAEGMSAPVKVSVGSNDYYTDSDSMLSDADVEAILALEYCKLMQGESEVTVADIVNNDYTADTAYTLIAHEKSNAGNGYGKHTVTCANCDFEEIDDCDKALDSELEKRVFEPTEDEEGYTLHKCSLCEAQWKGEILPKVIGVKTELENNSISVESLTVPVALKNNPNLKGMEVNVQYDATRLTLTDLLLNDSKVHTKDGGEAGNRTYVIAKASEIASFDEKITEEELPVLFKLVFTPVAGAVGDTVVKVNVEVVDDVTDYEYLVNNLTVALIDTDLDAAEAVDALIGALTVQSLDDKPAVEAARAAYDDLTDSQKALVKKLTALQTAEALIADFQAAADQEAADKAAAAPVIALIEKIGAVTLESEADIIAARAAYELLTDAQKERVGNYSVLVTAESALAALKDDTAKKALLDKINAALALLEETAVAEDASKVAKGEIFVTSAVAAALQTAVDTANVVLESNVSAKEYNEAAEELAAAIETFETAKQIGTFVAIVEADELKNDFLYKDGVRINNYVLVKFGDNVYFVSDYHKIEKDQLCYIGESYLVGTDYKSGYYYFDAEGKMSVANGPVANLFLIDGVIQDAYKVYSYGENFYYTTDGRRLAKNTVIYLSTAALAGTGLAEGYYAFDENGVMTAANGVIGDYFYKEGTRVQAYTLVADGEDLYYVSDYHKLAKNKKIYLTKEALAQFGKNLPSAYYDFNEDGKLVLHNGPVGEFFYVDGARQVAYQLYEYEGEIYYTTDYHKLAKNTKVYLTASVIGDRDIKVGYHNFDEDGKLID